MDTMTFVGRGYKDWTVEVRFITKVEAALHATNFFRNEKVNLLSTYKDKRSVRLRIGKVKPEIKLEWVVAAILSITEDNPEIITVSKINSLN